MLPSEGVVCQLPAQIAFEACLLWLLSVAILQNIHVASICPIAEVWHVVYPALRCLSPSLLPSSLSC